MWNYQRNTRRAVNHEITSWEIVPREGVWPYIRETDLLCSVTSSAKETRPLGWPILPECKNLSSRCNQCIEVTPYRCRYSSRKRHFASPPRFRYKHWHPASVPKPCSTQVMSPVIQSPKNSLLYPNLTYLRKPQLSPFQQSTINVIHFSALLPLKLVIFLLSFQSGLG